MAKAKAKNKSKQAVNKNTANKQQTNIQKKQTKKK